MSKEAEPRAKQVTDGFIRPLAKDIAANAEPLAQQLVEGPAKDIAREIAPRLEPATRNLTQEGLMPIAHDVRVYQTKHRSFEVCRINLCRMSAGAI